MLDSEIAAQAALLIGRDQTAAYAALLALAAESADSDGVYARWDDFAAMLTARSAFVRIRGIRLLSANARWDASHRLDAVLPELLRHITDPKPIAARECIQCLPALAHARPDLAPAIAAALTAADFSPYTGAMSPLLEQDRAEALSALRRRGG